MIYALIVGGYLQGTYPTKPECEMAANKIAGDQYQAITQWRGGKSLKKEDEEWRVIIDDKVSFRVMCQEKEKLTAEEKDRSDQDQMRRDHDRHRSELFSALRTRVLTDDEMREALAYGDMINIQENVSYYPEEKARERADAFQRQIILRLLQTSR